MRYNSETFFSADEKKIIEAAIKESEAGTSGEIVAMVVERSDSYRDIDVFISMIIASLISIYPAELAFARAENFLAKIIPAFSWASSIPDEARFFTGLSVFVIATVILHIPFRALISRMEQFKSWFIPLKRKETEVRERALKAFHDNRLGETRDATGVLFLVSLLERRVQVLADHGIYKKITQEKLDSFASGIAKGMKEGKGAEALASAINEAGKELSLHFPRKKDDTNELSDRVVTEI